MQRAIAQLHSHLVADLDRGGVLSNESRNAASTAVARGPDPIVGLEMRYSTGFEMTCPPATPMGPSDRAFGYVGAGGAFGFGDPIAKLGFGYAPNFMHMGVGPGQHGLALCEAVFFSPVRRGWFCACFDQRLRWTASSRGWMPLKPATQFHTFRHGRPGGPRRYAVTDSGDPVRHLPGFRTCG